MTVSVLLCAIIAGASLVIGPRAWADVVFLANGGEVEGIVIRQTDEEVVVRVTWQGHVVLDRASVAKVERSSEAERQALLARWQQSDSVFKDEQRQQQEFEERQQVKGLALYRGRWVTQEELASIKEGVQEAQAEHKKREEAEQALQREVESRKALEGELRTLSDRLRTMQEEQLRLQQEIGSLRYVLSSAYRARRQHPNFVRDEHGNLLRVKEQDGRDFVELPDGTRSDLQSQDGRLRYTDRAGVQREVQPARP